MQGEELARVDVLHAMDGLGLYTDDANPRVWWLNQYPLRMR